MEEIEKYISLSEAAKFCPYSAEYLSLRARQGKLRAIKIGRNWVTKREWVEEYLRKYQGKEETIKPPTSFFKLPTSKLRFEILFALTLLLFFISFALAKDSLKSLVNDFVPVLKEVSEDFVIGASSQIKNLNSQFSKTLSVFKAPLSGAKTIENFKNVFSLAGEGAKVVAENFSDSLSSTFQKINFGVATIGETTQKGLASVSEFFQEYFQWLGEKFSKIPEMFKKKEIQKVETPKETPISTQTPKETPKEFEEKITSLEEKIRELEERPPQIKEVEKEVERKVVVEPVREVVKITEIIPSEELSKIKSQLAVFGEYQTIFKEYQRKIQLSPPQVEGSKSPVYFPFGIETERAGIFPSLISEEGFFRTLKSEITTLGSFPSDKLTIKASSYFKAPITIGENALTIDTSGNLSTKGEIFGLKNLYIAGKVGIGTTTPVYTLDLNGNLRTAGNFILEGNLTVLGAQTYSGAAYFEVTSTSPGLTVIQNGTGSIVLFKKGNQSIFEIENTGAINLSALSTSTFYVLGNLNQLVLGANGNVGIGTPIPLEKLTISGNILATGNLTIQGLTSLATTTISTQLTVPKITSLADNNRSHRQFSNFKANHNFSQFHSFGDLNFSNNHSFKINNY